jgi:ribosomal protein L40E
VAQNSVVVGSNTASLLLLDNMTFFWLGTYVVAKFPFADWVVFCDIVCRRCYFYSRIKWLNCRIFICNYSLPFSNPTKQYSTFYLQRKSNALFSHFLWQDYYLLVYLKI